MASLPLNKATLIFKQVAEDARALAPHELEIKSLDDFFNEVFDNNILRFSSQDGKAIQRLLVARIQNDLDPKKIGEMQLEDAEEKLKSIRDQAVTHLEELFQLTRDDPSGDPVVLEKGPKEILDKLKTNLVFTGTVPVWEGDLTTLEAAEQMVKNYPEAVLTPLYQDLDSILSLNFSLIRKQPDIFLRARRDAGIDDHQCCYQCIISGHCSLYNEFSTRILFGIFAGKGQDS